MAALAPDVTVLGRSRGRALVRLGRSDDAVELAGQDAPRAALLAARYFLDAAAEAGTQAWRVAELPAEHALDEVEFVRRLDAAGITADTARAVDRPYAPPPRPSRTGGHDRATLCVLPPLGRIDSAQWRVLVEVADEGSGRLRVTPWRSVVLPSAGERAAARIEAVGLVLTPDSPWENVTACTGRPGCAKSLADVRADARAVADRARGPLPVHWSGCERRCGHPRGTAWVDLVATGSGYRLAAPDRPVRDDVRPTELAAALADARTDPDVVKK